MKNIRRAMHFDFHTMPGIDNILKNFDAEVFSETLKTAHVEYMNFTARCNIGFSYYNTKVGKKYPNLKRDILKEVVAACHKRNIGVSGYINAGINHELGADNKSYCVVSKDGKTEDDDKYNNFYRMMCFNSGYTDYLISEIDEIIGYGVDGIFCDCFDVVHPCYCHRCMKKMQELGINTDDYNETVNYQKQLRMEVAEKIKVHIGGKVRVYFNGIPWRKELHSHAEIECLTSGKMWGHGYFEAVAPLARTLFTDRIFMTGRFADDWGDFGGITTEYNLMNDMYTSLMHCTGISVGDHLHPVDGLFSEVVKRVGNVYAERIKYEPYCDNSRYICEVGVLAESEDDCRAPTYLKGTAKLLSELKIPFDIYTESSDFSALKLLIIPKTPASGKNFADKLKTFTRNGGKVIFAGNSVKCFSESGLYDYIYEAEDDYSDNAYFTLQNSAMRYSIYSPVSKIKNKCGEELAGYCDNIFNFHYDGRQSYFYRPQGSISDYSVCVSDGNTALISFDIFTDYAEVSLKEHRDLLSDAINRLLPEKFIESKGLPSYAELSVTENAHGRVVHIKTNFPEIKGERGVIEDPVYFPNATITIQGKYKVFTLPNSDDLSANYENGRTIFNTGEIAGYKSFLLK